MPNDKISAVGTNIAEKAAMIWNVADMLRGQFKPHEYGLVILPMTVIKCFHDCLLYHIQTLYSFSFVVCLICIYCRILRWIVSIAAQNIPSFF